MLQIRFSWPRAAWIGIWLPLLSLALPSCRVTDWPLWGPAGTPTADAIPIQEYREIAYYSGPDADNYRHRLDLFLPKDRKDFPVVMLVHGGAWMIGDNRCCGLYSEVGKFLASQGIGAVLPNYRLSPGVQHPEHIRDVARAFAWTRSHIGEYGGDPEKLFLAGHSAGGHLVTLLATDESYLKEVDCKTTNIKGVIAFSGVYRITPGSMGITLGGANSLAFRLDEAIPIRGASLRDWTGRSGILGIPLNVNIFAPVFGNDPKVRAEASPVNHVRPGLPPFLIFYAENDLPSLAGLAVEFQKSLANHGCDAWISQANNRNHNSSIFQAIEPDDPVAASMLDFIRRISDAPKK